MKNPDGDVLGVEGVLFNILIILNILNFDITGTFSVL